LQTRSEPDACRLGDGDAVWRVPTPYATRAGDDGGPASRVRSLMSSLTLSDAADSPPAAGGWRVGLRRIW